MYYTLHRHIHVLYQEYIYRLVPFKFAQHISKNGAIINDLNLSAKQLKQSKSVVLGTHFQPQSQCLNNLHNTEGEFY